MAVAALALAVGMAACGSDDGDDGGSSANGGAADVSEAAGSADADAEGGSDEEQIKAVYAQLVEAMYAGDGKAACALMTPKTAKGFGKQQGTTCEKRVKDNASTLAEERPFIDSLQVQGDRALARAGAKSTLKYPVPFRKRDGKWLISGGF